MERYRTAQERRSAPTSAELRKAQNADAAERRRLKVAGDDVPTTPEGIARWWKQRGR